MKHGRQRGFTLIELLTAIAIGILITAVGLSNFRRYQAHRSVEGALEIVLSQITRAHLDTISSRNDKAYGIHLDSDKITYFTGGAYDPSDATNIISLLPTDTEMVSINLLGGGNDIFFKRVTGDTDQSGNFIIRSKNYNDTAKTIKLNSIGSILY